MALRLKSKTYDKHRGINDVQEIKRIEDDHVSDLINFDYVPVAEGKVSLEMRDGTVMDIMETQLSGGTAVQGIYSADFNEGTDVVFSYNQKLYKLAAPPDVLVSGVSDVMNSFTMIANHLIIANGTDALKEYSKADGDVVNVSGASAAPVFKYVHQWHNFLIGSGISGTKNRIQFSALSDRTTWPSGGINDRPYGEITGISSLADTLYIFYLNHIEKVTGYSATFSDFYVDLFASIGCISHYSIVSNGSTLFFISRDGPYAIGALGATSAVVGGTSLIKLAPHKIKSFWDELDLTRDLIHGVHDINNSCIRWSVRKIGSSYNDAELIFDYTNGILGYKKTTGRYISCYTLGKNSSNQYVIKCGNSNPNISGSGVIFRFDKNTMTDFGINSSGTVIGNTITGTITTKIYDMGKPDEDKLFETLDIVCKSAQTETPLDIYYGVGDNPQPLTHKRINTDAILTWDSGYTWDSGLKWLITTFKNYSIRIRKRGKALALKFMSGVSGKKIKIFGWTINYQSSKKKGTADL